MTDLSKKSVLCWDHGLFLSFALRMGAKGGFGKVYYHNATRSGRPSFNELSVGEGYEEITVVKNPWDVIDKVDVVAFPDVLDGDLQVYLRKLGYNVWGAGKGDELELYRMYWKKVVEALGLPVNDYEVVKGIPKLRDYLQENPDQYIKVSLLRGLMESRHHEEYWLSKNFIDRLEYKLGPLSDSMEFLVEEPVETKVEVAADHYFCGGGFPRYALNGIERKDMGYVGRVQEYDKMPEQIRLVDDALIPVLTRVGYANMFAVELRISKEGEPYPIDPCCRQSSPAGEAQLAMWTNFPQVVWHGAHGELIDPEFDEPFVAQAMIYSNGDEGDWSPVKLPKEVRPFVNLYFGLRKGNEDYAVPQHNGFDEIGSVIGKGNTLKEARELCQKRADMIKGDVSIKCDALEEAESQYEEMEKMGMDVEVADV
jgi:hypothetical protein